MKFSLRPDSLRTHTQAPAQILFNAFLPKITPCGHAQRPRSRSNQKIFSRGAMSVNVGGRCESHFLFSRAQIIAEGRRYVQLLRYDQQKEVEHRQRYLKYFYYIFRKVLIAIAKALEGSART